MKPIYDLEAALRRMGQDEQLLREMISLLGEDAPRLLREVELAYEGRDADRLHHAAHKLKGLSANFSAERAADAADALQRQAPGQNWNEIAARIAELQEAVNELLNALQPQAAQVMNLR